MLEVWTGPTPNGHRCISRSKSSASIQVIPGDIGAGDQSTGMLEDPPPIPDPGAVDPEGPGGKHFTLFDNPPRFLIYCPEKNGGKMIQAGPVGRLQMLEWIMFPVWAASPDVRANGTLRS